MSWTEVEARRQLAALEASGLSVVEFCDETGVSPQRIWYWRARLRGSAGGLQLPQLVEVALRPAAPVACGPFVLEFPSGHVLRVPAGVELAEVLRAAGLAAC